MLFHIYLSRQSFSKQENQTIPLNLPTVDEKFEDIDHDQEQHKWPSDVSI